MPINETIPTLSVSQLNEYVKSLLEGSRFLSRVCVSGEISNFKHHTSGHLYFTLKDEAGTLKCVMFRSDAMKLKFEPRDSMKVLVSGRVSVFVRDGVYQLYADSMTDVGLGELYAAFERMKLRLDALGLFAPEHKKPLPRFPKTVGIITSPIGAAVADMKNILSRRYPIADIWLYPAKVQGDGAEDELIAGLSALDGQTDVILLGRGGGSIEDLWAFNGEKLAKAIYNCRTPVISCVGHETDFTICDFVADLRAPTPSAAAELAVPDMTELLQRIGSYDMRITSAFLSQFDAKAEQLRTLAARPCFTSPLFFTERRETELINLQTRFHNAAYRVVERNEASLASVAGRLDALNPMKVISRGYAAVFGKEGQVIDSVGKVKKGDTLTLKVADGDISAAVL